MLDYKDLDLRREAKNFKDKLEGINVFIADVDGVLTPGFIYWQSEEVGFNRHFHALDGYGLKVLQAHGIKVGVLSGGKSAGLVKRCEGLGLDFYELGDEDKRNGYLRIKEKFKVSDQECLYIGDEFFDLPILKRVGFSATTYMASHEIKESVDYICHRPPGQGCVREVIDMVRYAQNIVPKVHDFD